MIGDATQLHVHRGGVFGGFSRAVLLNRQLHFSGSQPIFTSTHQPKHHAGHGLAPMPAFRFERGADPTPLFTHFKRAVLLMAEIRGARVEGSVAGYLILDLCGPPVETDLNYERMFSSRWGKDNNVHPRKFDHFTGIENGSSQTGADPCNCPHTRIQ